jgi:hypothetical protein
VLNDSAYSDFLIDEAPQFSIRRFLGPLPSFHPAVGPTQTSPEFSIFYNQASMRFDWVVITRNQESAMSPLLLKGPSIAFAFRNATKVANFNASSWIIVLVALLLSFMIANGVHKLA